MRMISFDIIKCRTINKCLGLYRIN